MKLAKRIAIGVAALALALILGSYLLPSKWRVERAIEINAPSERVYPYVANLKTGWPQWSVFDTQDPQIQYTYAGPDEGVGATRSWTSKKMGSGTQVITRADARLGVDFTLTMNEGSFVLNGQLMFHPSGPGTLVTWTDWGEVGLNPIQRWMVAFMDRMMGPAFETSLRKLKSKAETGR